MSARHVCAAIAIAFLVVLAQAPARASVTTGLGVSVTIVTGASLPAHALVTTGVTAPAAHTSSRAHLRAHHHARHPHRLHRRVTTDRGTLHGDWPAPGSPRHHGVDHRAAVPGALTRDHRVPTTLRQGMALPATTWAGTVVRVSRLDPEPGCSIARLEGRTISGRGPPLGTAESDPRLPRSFRSPLTAALPVPTVHLESAAPARATLPAGRHPAIPAALPYSAAPVPNSETEPVLDRSLVRRPEGATACFDPPSPGDTP